jgi:hypothetical protein
MASNGNHQSAKNIFSRQPNGGVAETLDASVEQDKTALTRGSPASPQPEPPQKAAQSHALNNNPQRAKKHGSTKRKTVHLVLWVKPIVKAELQRIADQEGLSLSKAAGTLLARALDGHMDRNYNALLTPIIETAIDKRMRARDARLAWLLVRVAFDAGQTRSLVTNILGRQSGMTEETLKTILAMSQRTAKGNITRRTPQLTELMEVVEKWLLAEHDEKAPNN